jgi:hypothetical protein
MREMCESQRRKYGNWKNARPGLFEAKIEKLS